MLQNSEPPLLIPRWSQASNQERLAPTIVRNPYIETQNPRYIGTLGFFPVVTVVAWEDHSSPSHALCAWTCRDSPEKVVIEAWLWKVDVF